MLFLETLFTLPSRLKLHHIRILCTMWTKTFWGLKLFKVFRVENCATSPWTKRFSRVFGHIINVCQKPGKSAWWWRISYHIHLSKFFHQFPNTMASENISCSVTFGGKKRMNRHPWIWNLINVTGSYHLSVLWDKSSIKKVRVQHHCSKALQRKWCQLRPLYY